MGQVIFSIPLQQRKEWIIVSLWPRIRLPLTQHNIGTQDEALEIVMKMEASLIGGTCARVQQIQN